jgi:DNA-binding CsgD family transcriptional regulator
MAQISSSLPGANWQVNESILRGPLSWRLLDQVGCGICVVDESMQLIYANTRCREMSFASWFTAGGRLEIRAGNTGAVQMRSAIASALFGKASILQFFDSGNCVVIALSPIDTEHHERAVLITSERVHLLQSVTFQVYAKALRLTPKEIEVLVELASGREPKVVASDMHVSIETVRSHIKALLGKASAGSLRELLLRVAKLPPIVSNNSELSSGQFAPRDRAVTSLRFDAGIAMR